MKNQIILIGGGRVFKDMNQAYDYYKNFDIDLVWNTKSWKDWIMWSLEDKYDFIFPKFPTKDNADYTIWKIIFEKYINKITDSNPIFITHSLGTIFILKYLTENGFKIKIKELHLISPIVDNKFQPVDDNENTGTFTFDTFKIKEIEKYCKKIHIWHSTDDTVCSFKNAEFIKQELPKADLHVFSDRNHFSQSTFHELFLHLK